MHTKTADMRRKPIENIVSNAFALDMASDGMISQYSSADAAVS